MAVITKLEEKFQPDLPYKELVYEDKNVRVLRFYLKKDQEIKPHSSPSSVLITVLKGKLVFSLSTDDKAELTQGDSIFYEPEEPHGFKALEDSIVQATIAPNPLVV